MNLGVLQRVDAMRGQPVVQPHRMGAGGEGLGEGVVALLLGHQLGQAGTVHRALVGQLLRQRDGLAVVVQVHQDGHVLLRPGHAHLHAVDQAPQHMGHVQFAVDELVSHPSPAGLLGRDDLHAVLLVEAQRCRHHHAGAVGQRDEANAHLLLLGRIRAGGPGAAGQHPAGTGGGSTGRLQDLAPAQARQALRGGRVQVAREQGAGLGGVHGRHSFRKHQDRRGKRKRRPTAQP